MLNGTVMDSLSKKSPAVIQGENQVRVFFASIDKNNRQLAH